MTFEKLYDYLFQHEKEEQFVYYEQGRRTALSTSGLRRRIDIMAEHISNSLADVPKNSWTALKCANSGNWTAIFFAVLKSGYRVLLLDENTPAQQLESFVRCADVKCIITDSSATADVGVEVLNVHEFNYGTDVSDDLKKYVWADKIAYVTSGTTSEAKIYTYTAEAVLREQYEVASLWKKINEKHNFVHSTCMMQVLPLRHIFGLVTFFCGIACGYTVVFPQNIGILELIRVIKTESPWLMPAVPAVWKGLIGIVKAKCGGKCTRTEFESIFGSGLTCGVCAGAKLDSSLAAEVIGAGITLYGGWGMTEVGAAVIGELTYENIQSGYVGDLIGQYEYALIDDEGRKTESDTGELAINGDLLYYSMLTPDGEVLRSDEYFMTGDIFTCSGRKFCFVGRKKNVIISDSGENAYPEEIEEKIYDITAGLMQSCVFDYKGTAALYVYDPDINGREDSLAAAIRQKNGSLSTKNKISAIFVSCKPMELTSKGEISRFRIADRIQADKNIKKYIIMKGLLSDENND